MTVLPSCFLPAEHHVALSGFLWSSWHVCLTGSPVALLCSTRSLPLTLESRSEASGFLLLSAFAMQIHGCLSRCVLNLFSSAFSVMTV